MLLRRLFALLAAGGLVVVAAASPVAAADPVGVAFDGTLAVTFREPGAEFGADGAPIAGATVTVRATVNDFDPPVQVLEGRTAADGTATFGDVARSLDAGTNLVLAVSALLEVESIDEQGCRRTSSWFGSVTDLASGPDVSVDLVGFPSSSVACPPPTDGPLLTGTVRSSDGGLPTVERAHVEMTRADGERWTAPFEPQADGSFAVPVRAWGTADEPARLVVVVAGPAESERTEGDCVYQVGQLGTVGLDVALAGGSVPEPIEVVTRLGDLSGVCGAAGTPAPGGPSVTPPPTDGTGPVEGPAGFGPRLGGLFVALGLALVAAGGGALGRSIHRRG